MLCGLTDGLVAEQVTYGYIPVAVGFICIIKYPAGQDSADVPVTRAFVILHQLPRPIFVVAPLFKVNVSVGVIGSSFMLSVMEASLPM